MTICVYLLVPVQYSPPLCAGALWPMPAWVWRDVRFFYYYYFYFFLQSWPSAELLHLPAHCPGPLAAPSRASCLCFCFPGEAPSSSDSAEGRGNSPSATSRLCMAPHLRCCDTMSLCQCCNPYAMADGHRVCLPTCGRTCVECHRCCSFT